MTWYLELRYRAGWDWECAGYLESVTPGSLCCSVHNVTDEGVHRHECEVLVLQPERRERAQPAGRAGRAGRPRAAHRRAGEDLLA